MVRVNNPVPIMSILRLAFLFLTLSKTGRNTTKENRWPNELGGRRETWKLQLCISLILTFSYKAARVSRSTTESSTLKMAVKHPERESRERDLVRVHAQASYTGFYSLSLHTRRLQRKTPQ